MRIEFMPNQFSLYIKKKKYIDNQLKKIDDVDYITIDIYGFRSGSFDINK